MPKSRGHYRQLDYLPDRIFEKNLELLSGQKLFGSLAEEFFLFQHLALLVQFGPWQLSFSSLQYIVFLGQWEALIFLDQPIRIDQVSNIVYSLMFENISLVSKSYQAVIYKMLWSGYHK